jgi:hypothetical protein
METSYSITITIPKETLSPLVRNNFSLVGFKGVQGAREGRPVVWFETTKYLEETNLTWVEDYHAYISEEVKLEKGTVITAQDTCSIKLQQLVTADRDGLGVPEPSALPGIAIRNVSTQGFTCGLAQVPPSQAGTLPQPLCAFELLIDATEVIVPAERVVLFFAKDEVKTGAVEEFAFTNAVLIEFGAETSKDVTYDTSRGGWQEGSGVTPIPADTDLVSILIHPEVAIPGLRR